LKRIVLLKRVLFVMALVPAAALAYNAYTGDLTANPVDYIEDFTGDWAIAFLIISLAVTPLRRVTKWNEIIRIRRMLGLFAFFYATLHVLTWIALVSFFDFPTMLEDIAKRPFITVGMGTFLVLLALAVTSTQGSIRRLGRRWGQLHSLVYVAAVGGVVHFWWLVKADITEPRRWAFVLVVLLGFRIWWTLRKRMLSLS
jgi:methionine sulfoxide reductase heme-binding subunit